VDLTEETCASQGDRYCTFKASFIEQKEMKAVSSTMEMDLYSKENIKLLTTLASHSITAIENTFLFEKAKKESVIDGLTRIYNHGYFQQALRVEAGKTCRYKTPLTLVMLDIDNFKSYNDHYGHPHGDSVLKSVAAFLVDNVREVDVVARYGGDEFALLLPQTIMDGAKIVTHRVRKEMQALMFRGDSKRPTVHLTLSMGVAVCDGKKAIKPSDLLQKADSALLVAKRKGKGRVVFAGPL
jgi:diguanylate cyclase (GGDEF)-like protein